MSLVSSVGFALFVFVFCLVFCLSCSSFELVLCLVLVFAVSFFDGVYVCVVVYVVDGVYVVCVLGFEFCVCGFEFGFGFDAFGLFGFTRLSAAPA